MKRREFIRLLGGALAAQASPANAQELRVRTVGVLMGFANDAEAKARVQVFEQGLESEGWSLGQNLRIESSRKRRARCVISCLPAATLLLAVRGGVRATDR